MSLGTDIIEYNEMLKNKQKREHFRALIDAGMVEEIENIKVNEESGEIEGFEESDKIDLGIFQRYVACDPSVCVKLQKYIEKEKEYASIDRKLQRIMAELDRSTDKKNESKIQDSKESSRFSKILSFISDIPKKIGNLVKIVKIQLSKKYRETKGELSAIEIEVYDALQAVNKSQSGEKKDWFLDISEEIYEKYENKLPLLMVIYQNKLALKHLQENGNIPVEFVTFCQRIYNRIIKSPETTHIKHEKQLMTILKNLGRAVRKREPVRPEELKRINNYISGKKVEQEEVSAEIVPGKEAESEETVPGKEAEKAAKAKPKSKEKGPKSSSTSKDGRQAMRRRLRKETPDKNIPLNMDYLEAIASSTESKGNVKALLKEIGKGSTEDGYIHLENAVNEALRGKPIHYSDPMLKEVVDDYIKYRNGIKGEAKAKKKLKGQTPEGEVKD